MGVNYHVMLLRRINVSLGLLQVPSVETLKSIERQRLRPTLWHDLRSPDVRNDAGLTLLHLVLRTTTLTMGRFSFHTPRLFLDGSRMLFPDPGLHSRRSNHFLVLLHLRDMLRYLFSDDG
jgi:hypothetical protein